MIDDRTITKYMPSIVYDEARTSLVYRLSEAMFASLSAAYVIGFISFIQPLWPHNHDWGETRFLLTVRYITISAAFAFLTMMIYVVYNTNVLTLFSYELRNGSRDFVFCVSQGVFFGLAMAWPGFLISALLTVYYWGYWILRTEHKILLRRLREVAELPRHEDRGSGERLDAEQLQTVLEEIKRQRIIEWLPPSRFHIWLAPLIAIASFMMFIVWNVHFESRYPSISVWVIPGLNVCALGFVFHFARHHITNRGEFLRQIARSRPGEASKKASGTARPEDVARTELDSKYIGLMKRLKEISEQDIPGSSVRES